MISSEWCCRQGGEQRGSEARAPQSVLLWIWSLLSQSWSVERSPSVEGRERGHQVVLAAFMTEPVDKFELMRFRSSGLEEAPKECSVLDFPPPPHLFLAA